MTSSQIEEIESLILSIRNKTQTIVNKTYKLKTLNKKLQLLLSAIETYSFEQEDENIENKTELNTIKVNKKPKVSKSEINGRDDYNIMVNNAPDSTIAAIADEKPSISNLFKHDKTQKGINQKGIAMQLYKILENTTVISLDDLVKGIKISKYKVIEILNILVKEKIVLKFFDKNFMYKLNK